MLIPNIENLYIYLSKKEYIYIYIYRQTLFSVSSFSTELESQSIPIELVTSQAQAISAPVE